MACKHPIRSQPLDTRHHVACTLCAALYGGSRLREAEARKWVPFLHDSIRTPELARMIETERADTKHDIELAEAADERQARLRVLDAEWEATLEEERKKHARAPTDPDLEPCQPDLLIHVLRCGHTRYVSTVVRCTTQCAKPVTPNPIPWAGWTCGPCVEKEATRLVQERTEAAAAAQEPQQRPVVGGVHSSPYSLSRDFALQGISEPALDRQLRERLMERQESAAEQRRMREQRQQVRKARVQQLRADLREVEKEMGEMGEEDQEADGEMEERDRQET